MSVLNKFLRNNGLYIDLGTENTLIYGRGLGWLVNEPSFVSYRMRSGRREMLVGGREAKLHLGRNPQNIIVDRPLREGVIADFDSTERMLKHFMEKAQSKALLYRPDMIISLPCKVTEYEKRAVQEVGRALGGGRVHLVDEPMAAAVGAGLAVTQPRGQIVVDIGGGTTEIAVISLGGVSYANAVRVGGHEMDERIVHTLRHQFNILIGEPTAEQLKIRYADALHESTDLMEFKGVNLYNGLPKICTLPKGIIHNAIEPVIENIIEATRQALSQTPPELSADIAEQGIWLAGGGALITNLPERLSAATGLKVSITRDPLFSVARGGAYLLEHPELLEKVS